MKVTTKRTVLVAVLVAVLVGVTMSVFPVGCATFQGGSGQETKDKFMGGLQTAVTGLKWLTVVVDPIFKGMCASGTIDPGACATYALAAPLARAAFDAADQAFIKYHETKQPADLEAAKQQVEEAAKAYDQLYKTPVNGTI